MNTKQDGWEQVTSAPSGTIFADQFEDGVRIIIMRGPSALCAYLGLPISHPLAGFNYDNIPLDCHGGLTFGRVGDGNRWPSDFFWYGWDYAHCDDYSTYYDDPKTPPLLRKGKKWTVDEVLAEAKSVAWDFAKLMDIAEKVGRKSREANND